MTKERATDLCKAIDIYLCTGNPIWDVEEIHDAMSMAIEALQAQATLDDVSNAYENGYQQGKFEATQKTGKWMTPKEYCQYLYETTGERCSPMATGLESFVYCSQCGEPSWFSKNYCPHCGARMECDEE